MELNIGDNYKCPKGHKAKIVWIQEDRKVIGVKCSKQHLSKVVKGKEIYQKDFVFLMSV